VTRREALLLSLAGGTLAASPAEARDYTSPAEVLDTIDRLSAEVDASLVAIARKVPGAQPFADSVRADHARQRRDRDALRARMRLASAPVLPAAAGATALDALREAQQELVHAHAEGMPALHDPAAVQVLAGHMVDLARHLTVIDLWIELESPA
jgi:hypothetical protein